MAQNYDAENDQIMVLLPLWWSAILMVVSYLLIGIISFAAGFFAYRMSLHFDAPIILSIINGANTYFTLHWIGVTEKRHRLTAKAVWRIWFRRYTSVPVHAEKFQEMFADIIVWRKAYSQGHMTTISAVDTNHNLILELLLFQNKDDALLFKLRFG